MNVAFRTDGTDKVKFNDRLYLYGDEGKVAGYASGPQAPFVMLPLLYLRI